MKLFLHGGGGGRKDSVELDKKFVASLNLSKPLLYIPIAIDTKEHPYPNCLRWLSRLLGPLGVSNIVMWIEEDLKNKKEDDFTRFSGVYIGGGNTFKLLKELKEFGTFDILKKLVEKDIPICGGSAGAIILGRTITSAMHGDENSIGLADLSALNLIKGYDVWSHYFESEDSILKEYAKKYNLKKILAIPETAGLYVTEEFIEAIGPSNSKVFENESSRIIHPGQKV